MKKLWASIVLALVLVGCVIGTSVMAFAAGTFSATTDGGSVNPGGKSDSEIIAALNEKIESLNTQIEEITTGGGNLEEAYNKGELLAYSNIESSNGIIDEANRRSGWKVWEGAAMLDLKFIQHGVEMWDGGIAWLSYNGVDDEAYIITAEFANQYQTGGNQKLGSAVGDMFRIVDEGAGTYVAYQNFTNGYIRSDNGTTTVVNEKNVKLNEGGTDVTEVDADPLATGFVGAATASTASTAGMTQQALYQAFVDAYNRYAEEGIDVGYSFSPVMAGGQNSSGEDRYCADLISQNFRFGDSVTDPWNDSGRSSWAFLALNPEEGRVYLIRDEFSYAIETVAENTTSLGYPVSDIFEATDGNRYQNYSNGYMMAAGSTAQNTSATAYIGQNVNSDGVASDIDLTSRVGRLDSTVTESVIPDTYTLTTFSQAMVAAYEEKVEFASDEELQTVTLATYSNGFIYQLYTDTKGGTHMLAYVAAEDTFVYLRPAVYSAYASNTAVGYPTGERITAAETDDQTIYAYPFSNGYVRLTASEQRTIVPGEGIVTILNESASVTVGSIYNAEDNFFETTNYSENITESIVNDGVISSAYWTIWGIEQPTKAEIAEAFVEAYNAAFEIGFSCGVPVSEGIVWWTTGQSGVIKLTLQGGNGTANFWGDNTLMTYNPEDGKVYITTDKIADCYAAQGASGNGWATTEMMINTATGVIVQQFNITDTDVTDRQIYIIVTDGTASKVSGVYDFEANKGSGEWVEFISQFGGSISSAVVPSQPDAAVGDTVTIDFSQYVVNEDGYTVSYELVSGDGQLSDAGVYTVSASEAGSYTVTVTAQSVFDKLTFTVTYNVTDGSEPDSDPDLNPDPGTDPDTDPDDPEDPDNTGLIVGIVVAAVVVIAAVVVTVVLVRKKKAGKQD